MADSATNRIETPAPHGLEGSRLIVRNGDIVSAARSLRTISRELTAAAARVKAATPATPVLGELPSGESCTLEEWASSALLGVADHFREQARQAIRWARAERRREALSVARAGT
jgi:TfoX/Sxy family transcriptional regulator of competence genes